MRSDLSRRGFLLASGLFGFKPSRLRMRSGEADGGHERFKTNNALSRTVRDAAAQEAAAGLLDQLGHTVERVDLPVSPEPFFAAYWDAFLPRFAFVKGLAERISGRPLAESGLVDPFTASILEWAASIPPADHERGRRALDRISAMSVPLSRAAPTGQPIGTMFQADVGEDRLLFQLAFELEAARPWRDHWAPHSAMFAAA